MGCVKNYETNAEQTDRVYADQYPQRHATKSFAQRLYAHDHKAKDHDRKRYRYTQTGAAESMFVI